MRSSYLFVAACLTGFTPVSSVFANDVLDLSLQELLNVEVTSASKQRQPLSDAPAAIYVVTAEDIRRSGATSIPQALRDVPGLHVAQLDAQKWAISSRGFNGRFNNKMLVMLDGRTLYSPLFSGVYWEAQDYPMADIDRIEIIRGPNAALWGANAVNGVINIVTKHSADTQGGYVEALSGTDEQAAGLRFGGQLSENATARGYLKGFARDSLSHWEGAMDPNQAMILNAQGTDTGNDWSQFQLGGRTDIQLDSASELTLSMDSYRYDMQQVYHVPISSSPYEQYLSDEFDATGTNLLARYSRALSGSSEISLQAYYDYVKRDEELFGFTTDTLDLDFQHLFELEGGHRMAWGVGYRRITDDLQSAPAIQMQGDSLTTDLWSAFIRDEIELLPDTFWLTLATRVEHGTYAGTEWQPNVRALWQPYDQHRLWGSVAYAVRTPSRAERSMSLHAITIPPSMSGTGMPLELWVNGNDEYTSEEVISYELGHRYSPSDSLSFDTALYYNDYDELRGSEFTGFTGFPIPTRRDMRFNNAEDGYNYGLELSTQWLVNPDLKLRLNYSYSDGRFGGTQTQNTLAPEHMLSLSGDWTLNSELTLNGTWRYVSKTEALDAMRAQEGPVKIDSYQGVDLSLIWEPRPKLALSLVGRNLFYGEHLEYIPEQFHIPYRVEPSVFAKLALRF